PCCHAVATRRIVAASDLAADPKWDGFQKFAEPLGIRSAWSTPIFSSQGKVLGTFAHFYSEPRDPSPRDERMVELLKRAAAVAIERSRAEAALRELNDTLEQRVQLETRERLQIWNVSQDLLVIIGLDGKYLSVNPAWTATLGWSEADLLGKSSQWLLHPDDRESTRAEVDRLAKGHKTLRFENRLRAKDGSYHWISWKAAPDSGRIYSMGRDITELKRAEERLRVQHTVAQILAEAATIEEATPRILLAIGECLGWDVGGLWRVDREAEVLRCVELWHEASIEVPEFERVSRAFTFRPGLGLPGRVWSSLEPEYIPDVVPDENFPRAPIAQREGLHAAF